MVDADRAGPGAYRARRARRNRNCCYGSAARDASAYVIERRVIVLGEDLVDAQPGFDQRTSEPIVSVPLQQPAARGALRRPHRKMSAGRLPSCSTTRYLGAGDPRADHRRLGSDFRRLLCPVDNDLSILLRAGALPAPLTIIEERTVGAGLGQDSIEKGIRAAWIDSVCGHHLHARVLATGYLTGLFANIAVAFNVAMILGILSLLNATLMPASAASC